MISNVLVNQHSLYLPILSFWFVCCLLLTPKARLYGHHVNKAENLLNIKYSLLSCFTA